MEEVPVDIPSGPLDEEIPQANVGQIGQNFFDPDDEWTATLIGATAGGKGIQVVKAEKGLGYNINFRTGGELPRELRGMFTSYGRAEKQAREYINNSYAKANGKNTVNQAVS